LKPLPFTEPDRLVGMWHTAPELGFDKFQQSPSTYFTYRDDGRVFEDVGLWVPFPDVSITGRGEPERVKTLYVTDGTLPILKVPPLLGRLFTKADDAPGSPDRTVLTYGYWQRRFGGGRDIVGQMVTIDGKPHEVIGVLPASFRFLDTDPAVVLPFRLNRADPALGNFSYFRHRSAQGWRHDGAGERRCGTPDSARVRAVPTPGGRAGDTAEAQCPSAVGRRDWRCRTRAVDPVRHGRDRTVDGLRQRGEPLPRAGRGAPTGRSFPARCRTPSDRTGSIRRASCTSSSRRSGSVNPSLPLANVQTLDEIRADSMAQTSFTLTMLVIGALMALLLGIVGLYGVIAYIAAQRTREIGIRMALGAQIGDVRKMFLRHGLWLTTIGIALGVGAALALSRVMRALLFGVSPMDPMTYAAVSGALAAVMLLAIYLPARRAARVDPVVALRADV
jgi:hypothetical protein